VRYLPHRYDTIIVALTLTFVGFIPLFHSAEADPLRWWPPHGGWQVGLMQSDVYSAMFCTMNNARTIQGKLQGDGLSTLKGQLNITSFDEKADPQTNTALTVDIDGRLFGSFPVTGAAVNPNVLPMIMARIPGQQERALFSEIRDGKEMDVRASTFSHHFELLGSDLAIKDFFDCQRVLALHVP